MSAHSLINLTSFSETTNNVLPLREKGSAGPLQSAEYSLAGAVSSGGSIKMTEVIQSHEGMLVGLPWPQEARVTARFSDEPGVHATDEHGNDMWKTRTMVTRLLQLDGSKIGLRLSANIPVPPGKGCATSTKTIEHGTLAAARLLGRHFTDPKWLARQMAKHIEPTDAVGTVDGRLVLWDFFQGKSLSRAYRLPHGCYVGAYPRYESLDTESLAGSRPTYSQRQRDVLQALFRDVRGVLRTGSLAALAGLASTSADINEAVGIENQGVVRLRRLKQRGDILGYGCSHSGTACMAYAANQPLRALVDTVAQAMGTGWEVRGFENNAALANLPFLVGCGSTLVAVST